jgi:hypothetical protein
MAAASTPTIAPAGVTGLMEGCTGFEVTRWRLTAMWRQLRSSLAWTANGLLAETNRM